MATRGGRVCDGCGVVYYRRSLIEGWTAQAPGHREGWTKSLLKLCPSCAPGNVVLKVMQVAQAVPLKMLQGGKRGRRRYRGAA
jgi:hypothetical protein